MADDRNARNVIDFKKGKHFERLETISPEFHTK